MKKLFCFLVLLAVMASFIPGAVFAAEAESSEPVSLVVDLDLSEMSGVIVYSQIYNILWEPAEYLGKVIRMRGYYNYYDDQAHGIVYHTCIIPDATACCAQGIEFIWNGDHAWPDDYPEAGTDITVTGRLEIYEEDGSNYLHLVDAELTWEQEILQ